MAKSQSPRKTVIAEQFLDLLSRIGIPPGGYVWQPKTCDLYVVIGGSIRLIKIRASMTRVQIAQEMGRIVGWTEALAGQQAAR